jgi:hypothetical protein
MGYATLIKVGNPRLCHEIIYIFATGE